MAFTERGAGGCGDNAGEDLHGGINYSERYPGLNPVPSPVPELDL